MSRATPRRARHGRHPSSLSLALAAAPAVAPDYDSDAYTPPPPRSNTALNLSVLRRYLPSIQGILSVAANAVVYAFDGAAQRWDKAGVEGTLFVCAQQQPPPAPAPDAASAAAPPRPRACVFVLNRRSLDNLVVDLARVSHVEIAGELVIVRVDGGAGGADDDGVLGIWIHNDRDDTRHVNGTMIHETWRAVQAADAAEAERPPPDPPAAAAAAGPEAGPAMQAIGRRLSLSHLFGRA